METQKKRFLVIWGGVTILAIASMYFYYKEKEIPHDKLVIPKSENLQYDNKLEKLRKKQDNSVSASPKFTVADSIMEEGIMMEHPVRKESKQRIKNLENKIEQSKKTQIEAIGRFNKSLNEVDEEPIVKYYKPKGDRIIYKNGKAYINGEELKDQNSSNEELPAEFTRAKNTVEMAEKHGTPMSYEAPQYNLSDGVIPCVVHTTQVVKNGSGVILRTTKEAMMGAIKIPRNTLLTAIAKYNNDRVSLVIKYMKIDGNFYTANMVGLGDDGNEGLPLSASIEMQVVNKEVGNAVVNEASTMLSGLGIAGRAAGSIVRGVNSATQNQKQKEIKLISNQKINFVSYEN